MVLAARAGFEVALWRFPLVFAGRLSRLDSKKQKKDGPGESTYENA
jgi:hypothetical protein